MAPPIPDRWEAYMPVGKQIPGTRFIAFKVPLRENVAAMAENDTRLSVNSLIEVLPQLGIIIDLTNTQRYYDPSFFINHGIQYKKIMVPGRDIPAQRYIQEFKNAVNNFLNENRNNSKLIGVHCTHGVNRTGYMICNFMVSVMRMEPKNSIDLFGSARGHHIERINYINNLHQLGTPRPEYNWRSSTHADHRQLTPVPYQFRDQTCNRNRELLMRDTRHRGSISKRPWVQNETHCNKSMLLSTFLSSGTREQSPNSNWRHSSSSSTNEESGRGLYRKNGPFKQY